jgi:hypothetical protein
MVGFGAEEESWIPLLSFKKERAELANRIKALDTAIKVLGGKTSKLSGMPDARGRKISLAMKRGWKERKAGKKA